MARLYVPLDVNFPDDDKIEAVGLAGAGLFAQALCVCKRTLSDGRITRTKLRRLGADDALIDLCITVGLFAADADDAVRIPAWLGWNAPAESVLTSERAKQLAHKRHHESKGVVNPSCRYCTDADALVDADGCADDADRTIAQCADALPEVETESEPSLITSENHSDSPPPDRSADDVEQATRKALKLYGDMRTTQRAETRGDVQDFGAYAKGVRDGAMTDGTIDALRASIVGGMTPEQAADKAMTAPGQSSPLDEYLHGPNHPRATLDRPHPLTVVRPSCDECGGGGWVLSEVGLSDATRCKCNPDPLGSVATA